MINTCMKCIPEGYKAHQIALLAIHAELGLLECNVHEVRP